MVNSNVKIFGIALVVVLAGLGYFAANNGAQTNEDVPIALKTIDFGYQPLWTGPATITEVMRKDQILVEELKKLGLEIDRKEKTPCPVPELRAACSAIKFSPGILFYLL